MSIDYTKGTLRKPTNTDNLTPLQPYDWIYTAGKWAGRAIGVLAIGLLACWLLKGFV